MRRFVKHAQLAVGQMDAVAVDSAAAHQAIAGIGVGVVFRFGAQFFYPRDFVDVFGNVRLNQHIGIFLRQRADHFHLFGCRSGHETRRNDIFRAAFAVPSADQRFGFVVGTLRRVQQGGGSVSVHAHFARHNPHIVFRRRFKNRIDRLRKTVQ